MLTYRTEVAVLELMAESVLANVAAINARFFVPLLFFGCCTAGDSLTGEAGASVGMCLTFFAGGTSALC